MPPDPRILKWCHLPPNTLVGQRLRGVQILPDCTGDRARVRKIHFFSPNACPLEEKSPFLSFLGATKTKPYSFCTKKCGLTGATATRIVVGWRLGAFGFPLLYKC